MGVALRRLDTSGAWSPAPVTLLGGDGHREVDDWRYMGARDPVSNAPPSRDEGIQGTPDPPAHSTRSFWPWRHFEAL